MALGGTWSIGGALNTGRRVGAGCGTLALGLSFGGSISGDTYDETTEEYDGATWSAGGDLATGRNGLAGAGTQTAGLSFGGYTGSNSAVTEEYNGATWSGGGNLNTPRRQLGGCGTQNAGLSFNGHVGSAQMSNDSEEYNGSTWSAGNDCDYRAYNVGSAGTQSAGLGYGGKTNGTYETSSQEYNGTSWTAGGSLTDGRYQHRGFGTQSSAVCAGGHDGSPMSSVESYDGSTWSSETALSKTIRACAGHCGASGSDGGLICGGLTNNDATAYDTETEEWSIPVPTNKWVYITGNAATLYSKSSFITGSITFSQQQLWVYLKGALSLNKGFEIYLKSGVTLEKIETLYLQGGVGALYSLERYILGDMDLVNFKRSYLHGNMVLRDEVYTPVLFSIYQRINSVIEQVQ